MTEQEFEQLVTDLRPELVRIAARRGGRDQAEDAVQKATTETWAARKWETASKETVAGWLRQRSRDRGINELRGISRLREAQRNIRVLGDKGHKRANPAAYRHRDGEDR